MRPTTHQTTAVFTVPPRQMHAALKTMADHQHHSEDDDGLTTDEEMPEMGWHSDSESDFGSESAHTSSAHTSPRQTPHQTPRLQAATSPLVSPPPMQGATAVPPPPQVTMPTMALSPAQILQRCGLPTTPENLFQLQVQANKLLVDEHEWKKEHLPWMHKPCAFFDEALDRLKVEPQKRNQWMLQSRYGHEQAVQYTRYQQQMLAGHHQAQQSLQQVVQQQQRTQQQQPQQQQSPQKPTQPQPQQQPLPMTMPVMQRPLLAAVPSMMGPSAGLVCVR